MRVIVIGGGPGGLTTLKTLLHFPRTSSTEEAQFDPIILEAAAKIGGTFDQRSYENGCLVSSKQLTAFSDYRFPLTALDHPTMNEYVAYQNRYVEKFGLDSMTGQEWKGTELEGKRRIQTGAKVLRVEKGMKGGHDVTYETVKGTFTLNCDALAICCGLHVTPAIPHIEGLPSLLTAQSPPVATKEGLPEVPPTGDDKWEVKEGTRVIHSSQYKKREEFKDRRVLILGIGETSMDLSYEAIQGGAKEVVVCHRGGFLSFPKVLNDFKVFGLAFDGDLPIDGLITNLFETAYVHPWVAAAHLRWHVSDFVIKRVLYFLTGTQAGCGQFVGSLPPSRLGRAYVFLNKSSKAMPYINRPYKPAYRFLSTILRTEYLDPPFTSPLSIDLALWPSHVDSTGRVHFLRSDQIPQSEGMKRIEEERMSKREVRPDMVVYCTGYKQEWDWLGSGYPRGPGEVDVREMCDSSDLSMAFIGFVRPGVGAIPPISEQQAMLWAMLLTKKAPIPTSAPHYRLLASKTARIQYGVDYSAYMSTLAQDMGASPSLLTLYNKYGLHVLTAYCLGAAFVSFYRLTGFYESVEVEEVVTGEIWETIGRRGVVGNLFMGVIPMIFYGLVNGSAWLVEAVWLTIFAPILQVLGVIDSVKTKRE